MHKDHPDTVVVVFCFLTVV